MADWLVLFLVSRGLAGASPFFIEKFVFTKNFVVVEITARGSSIIWLEFWGHVFVAGHSESLAVGLDTVSVAWWSWWSWTLHVHSENFAVGPVSFFLVVVESTAGGTSIILLELGGFLGSPLLSLSGT